MTSQENATPGYDTTLAYGPAPAGYPIPMGTIMALYMSANSIPLGWLPCDGSSVSQSNFPNFYSNCCSTTPNLASITLIGAGGQNVQNGNNPFVVGNVGGEQMHTLSAPEMPSHQHFGFGEFNTNPWGTGNTVVSFDDPTGKQYFLGVHSGDTDNRLYGSSFAGGALASPIPVTNGTSNDYTGMAPGTTQAHNNMQPYCVVTYMIFTGYLPV